MKPSLEVKHAKMEEEKHRRRLLLNQSKLDENLTC